MAGLLGILLAFLVGSMGTLFQASYSISGAIISPLDGLFVTGISAPWVNKKGAICGFLTAFFFNMWLIIGKFVNEKHDLHHLPLSTSGCENPKYNSTFSHLEESAFTTQRVVQDEEIENPHTLYNISYCYLGTIGILIVMTISTIVSIITGVNDPHEMDESLIYKPSMKMYKWMWNKTHPSESDNPLTELNRG